MKFVNLEKCDLTKRKLESSSLEVAKLPIPLLPKSGRILLEGVGCVGTV